MDKCKLLNLLLNIYSNDNDLRNTTEQTINNIINQDPKKIFDLIFEIFTDYNGNQVDISVNTITLLLIYLNNFFKSKNTSFKEIFSLYNSQRNSYFTLIFDLLKSNHIPLLSTLRMFIENTIRQNEENRMFYIDFLVSHQYIKTSDFLLFFYVFCIMSDCLNSSIRMKYVELYNYLIKNGINLFCSECLDDVQINIHIDNMCNMIEKHCDKVNVIFDIENISSILKKCNILCDNNFVLFSSHVFHLLYSLFANFYFDDARMHICKFVISHVKKIKEYDSYIYPVMYFIELIINLENDNKLDSTISYNEILYNDIHDKLFSMLDLKNDSLDFTNNDSLLNQVFRIFNLFKTNYECKLVIVKESIELFSSKIISESVSDVFCAICAYYIIIDPIATDFLKQNICSILDHCLNNLPSIRAIALITLTKLFKVFQTLVCDQLVFNSVENISYKLINDISPIIDILLDLHLTFLKSSYQRNVKSFLFFITWFFQFINRQDYVYHHFSTKSIRVLKYAIVNIDKNLFDESNFIQIVYSFLCNLSNVEKSSNIVPIIKSELIHLISEFIKSFPKLFSQQEYFNNIKSILFVSLASKNTIYYDDCLEALVSLLFVTPIDNNDVWQQFPDIILPFLESFSSNNENIISRSCLLLREAIYNLKNKDLYTQFVNDTIDNCYQVIQNDYFQEKVRLSSLSLINQLLYDLPERSHFICFRSKLTPLDILKGLITSPIVTDDDETNTLFIVTMLDSIKTYVVHYSSYEDTQEQISQFLNKIRCLYLPKNSLFNIILITLQNSSSEIISKKTLDFFSFLLDPPFLNVSKNHQNLRKLLHLESTKKILQKIKGYTKFENQVIELQNKIEFL